MTVHEYPAHAHNPIPWDGDAAAWRAWTQRSVMLEEAQAVCSIAEPGHVVVEVAHSPVSLNPIGSFHGGLVAGIADAVAGALFCRSVPPEILPATISLNVEYHRPAFAPLRFTGRVANQGRSLLFADVEVHEREGRLCGRASVVLSKQGSVRPAIRP